MGDTKENGKPVKTRCEVTRVVGTIEYRCAKDSGHERERGNEECEVTADEYVDRNINWQDVAMRSRPFLEWFVTNEYIVGKERADNARKLLVRMYLTLTPRPGIAKSKS